MGAVGTMIISREMPFVVRGGVIQEQVPWPSQSQPHAVGRMRVLCGAQGLVLVRPDPPLSTTRSRAGCLDKVKRSVLPRRTGLKHL